MTTPSTPSFTAEQLNWLKANLPTGPAKRVFDGITPTTDVQQVGAYALLTAEQRKQLDDEAAKTKLQAQVNSAQAQVTQTVQVAQIAVDAAKGSDVDTSLLQQVVTAAQPIVEASKSDPAPPSPADDDPTAAPTSSDNSGTTPPEPTSAPDAPTDSAPADSVPDAPVQPA